MLELATVPSEPRLQVDLDAAAARVAHAVAAGEIPHAVVALRASATMAHEHGAARLVMAAEPALAGHDELAEALALPRERELLQLRRPLPLDDHATLVVRAFRPGVDDEAWLGVNNRAFAWHPEQGGWTVDDLTARMQESWFEPAGFLVHDDGHAIAGFCWTKIHADETPPLGEIFVIAVDPVHRGRGLGRELTLAGLDWLSDQGLGVAMLYVESDNVAARGLYEDLGFTVHHRKRWWGIELA